MGVFDKFNKKESDGAEKEQSMDNVIEKQKQFVADISLCELEKVDWTKFGVLLKQYKVLPNSYVKKPTSIEVGIGKNGRPMAILTFNSATSESVRKIMLLQDGAYQYVNGAVDDGKNENLLKIWARYRELIRYNTNLEVRRQGVAHKRQGERLMMQAQKMIEMVDIYDREQEFLEKNQNANFDAFYFSSMWLRDCNGATYYNELPQFVPLIKTEDGKFISGTPVIPFTPRTLEFCILHMTKGQMCEDGEYLDDFEEKCRKIQEFSCFESDEWDKVIEKGKNIVRTQFQVSCLEDSAES